MNKGEQFPELNRKQLQYFRKVGEIQFFDETTTLCQSGDNDYDLYIVLKGKVDILNPSNAGRKIVSHTKHQFTGDDSMLSQRSSNFDAVAHAGSKVLRVKSSDLKKIISTHSDISDLMLHAFISRQQNVLENIEGGVKLIGRESDKATYEIRDFLEKNHIWYNFIDVDKSENVVNLLKDFNLSTDKIPMLLNANQQVCENPSVAELATYTGVLMDFEDKIFDLLVVGAGPAGLAASVYAASEGLSVVTIDSNAPGGQAGKSSKIENYLGFPTGISGSDLANKAYVQAQKFGCNISIPHSANNITCEDGYYTVCATNGKVIKSHALIAATGAQYRKLPIDNIEEYEGQGVYYSATGMDVSACKGEVVGIVGGGNSAGQAALFLADHAEKVIIFLRGNDLGAKMSDYLVQRIETAPDIELLLETEIVELHGDSHLESIKYINAKNGTHSLSIGNLFTFIGAVPSTSWLSDFVEVDKDGFLCTGTNISDKCTKLSGIYNDRDPQSLECSKAGIFAVGDVRRGSVKRVASAVGEGSMAVSQVHTYLAEVKNKLKDPA